MARLAFIGGGGFAKEVLEIAELGGHQVAGYVADTEGVLDRPFWGGRDALLRNKEQFDAVCLAFGAVDRKTASSRAETVRWLTGQKLRAQALVSPHAIRSKGVVIEPGAIVAHAVVISVDAKIGPFAILNSAAVIGHDAEIGVNVTIAPGAFIGGGAKIGEDSLIGPGATVLQNLTVGSGSVVGVAASVVRSVPDGATVHPLRSKVLPTRP